MSIVVLGGGAFGTALATALASEGPVTLWARDAGHLRDARESRRLPGILLPELVTVSDGIGPYPAGTAVLLAVPMRALAGLLQENRAVLDGLALVACCKGIDPDTGRGPAETIAATCPGAIPALLTGPGFAAEIARGLPTALTLACADVVTGVRLQARLSTGTLRLYRTTDVTGAELGGALKNVIAIAAGIVHGSGLGESARAALITRGYAEMVRMARAKGAQADTLAGLSGLGDLVLTCCSDLSRNFRFGRAIARGETLGDDTTVEGVSTALAVTRMAQALDVEMPIASMVAEIVTGKRAVGDAVRALMARPLKQE